MNARAGRCSGRTVSVNFSQTDAAPDRREVIELLDDARADESDRRPGPGRSGGTADGASRASYHPAAVPPRLPGDRRPPARRAVSRCWRQGRTASGSSTRCRTTVALRARRDRRIGKTWAVSDGDIDYEPDPADSLAAVAERTSTPWCT